MRPINNPIKIVKGQGMQTQWPVNIAMDNRLSWVGYDGPDHLNIGCGVNPIVGAVNVDIQRFAGTDILFDFREPWPIKDDQFDKVTFFECIEHVVPEVGLAALREAYRVLRPHGLLIVETPDILGMCRELVAGNYGMMSGALYGGYDAPVDAHVYGYTKSSLTLLCHLAGFLRMVSGAGTDYHADQMPTIRVEAVKTPRRKL